MLYDKNDETFGPWGFLLLMVLCFVLLILCSGCASGPNAVEPDIIKLERRIAELETINRELTERLDRGITDIVTRIEYLFNCYEYEISRLLSEIDTSGAYDIDTSQD